MSNWFQCQMLTYKIIRKNEIMNKFLFFLPLVAVLLFTSCDDDQPTGDDNALLTLNFTSTYGDEPLMMLSRSYDYEDDMKLEVQVFQFYVTDITLLNGDQETPIMDVDLINFGDVYSNEDALAGKSIADIEIPEGNYTGISFGFGVDPVLNQTANSDYNAGHPLFDNYWGPQTGYIFYKFEANGDLDGNGEFEEQLSIHIGGNKNYNELSFEKPLSVVNGSKETLSFNIDLEKILISENGEYLDFNEVKIHHNADSPTANLLSGNIPHAVTIK